MTGWENWGGLKKHLEGCDYVEVECANSGYYNIPNDDGPVAITPLKCGKRVERRYLTKHQQECEYRQYTCEYCGYVDTYDAIAGTGRVRNEPTRVTLQGNHYDECAYRPLQCPNKCGEDVSHMDMEVHRKSCPLERLDCPFKSIGCKDKVRRKAMDKEEAHWALVDQQLRYKEIKLRCAKEELAYIKEELDHKNEVLGHTREELANRSEGLVLQLVHTNVLDLKFSARIGTMEKEIYFSDVLFHRYTIICFIILIVISWILKTLCILSHRCFSVLLPLCVYIVISILISLLI